MGNITPVFLENSNYIVRTIERADLNERYLGWLNDPEISRYLEMSNNYTIKLLHKYYESLDDNSHLLFAIIDRKSKRHIGNLTLNPISITNNNTGLGGMIGEKKYWGTTVFVESMELLIEYAFKIRKFQKIFSGVVDKNVSAIIASRKVGFEIEGIQRQQRKLRDGRYSDVYIFGKINPDNINSSD
jgi:RimJ/RimL family protein N-acetyltransferase